VFSAVVGNKLFYQHRSINRPTLQNGTVMLTFKTRKFAKRMLYVI